MMQAQNIDNFPLLRDMVVYLHACILGYIAHATDWDDNLLLRDLIATRMNLFYDKGVALSSGRNINLFKEENCNDQKRTCKSESVEEDA